MPPADAEEVTTMGSPCPLALNCPAMQHDLQIQTSAYRRELAAYTKHCSVAPVDLIRAWVCEKHVVHGCVHRWMKPMTVAEHLAAWDATHVSVNQPCTAPTCDAPGKRKRGSGSGDDNHAARDCDRAHSDAGVPFTCSSWLVQKVCSILIYSIWLLHPPLWICTSPSAKHFNRVCLLTVKIRLNMSMAWGWAGVQR